MAVFPDRIILKNSTDGDDYITTAIGPSTGDSIVPGEIVIGREDGYVKFYSLDANNNVVTSADPSLSSLSDVDLPSYDVIPDGAVLSFNASTETWGYSTGLAYDISNNQINDLSDVSVGPAGDRESKDVLYWNYSTQEYLGGPLDLEDLSDVVSGATTESGMVLTSNGFTWGPARVSYGDIEGAPQDLTDLNGDLTVEDLIDVVFTDIQEDDILFYNGFYWENRTTPPADLSGGVFTDIGDVTPTNLTAGAVPQYNPVGQQYVIQPLDYSYIASAPTDLGDFTNGPGYITSSDSSNLDDLGDVTVSSPSEGQMLIYRSGQFINEIGPPANISNNSIGDLSDVTYYQPGLEPGQLTVDNMGELIFDSPQGSGGITEKLSDANVLGFGISAIRDSDNTGSGVFVERGRGVTLRSDINFIRLQGRPDRTTNQPELRWDTGDSGAATITGQYVGLKLSAQATESVTYTFPLADGDVGDILATDGNGGLNWFNPNTLSGSSLNDLDDVDTATIPPLDGYGLYYNAAAGVWLPGETSNVDLGSSSIDELVDVDTTTNPPVDGQGLVWSASDSQWIPSDVSDVDLSASSISDLGDVDTTSLLPADGQALVWSEADLEWVPGTIVAAASSLDNVLQTGNTSSYGFAVGQGNANYYSGDTVIQVGDSTPSAKDYTIGISYAGSIGWRSTNGNAGDVEIKNTLSESNVVLSSAGAVKSLVSGELKLECDDGGVSIYGRDSANQNTVRFQTTPDGLLVSGKLVGTLSTSSSDSGLTFATKDYVDATTGGGGGSGGVYAERVSQSVQASSGLADFDQLGRSGTLVSVSSDIDAWVCFYASSSTLAADTARPFDTDPAQSSGLLAEFYIQAGDTILATPGTVYFNDDTEPTELLHAIARDTDGVPVNATITTAAYAHVGSGGNGGAVDSVNEQTGAVSLGIQDMDDFKLNGETARAVFLDTRISAPPYCFEDGQFSNVGNDNDNPAVGNWFTYYNGGNDYVQFQKLVAGDPLLFTFDDGSTHATTFVGQDVNALAENWMSVADPFPTANLNTTTLTVRSDKFDEIEGVEADIPLAEGDALQWDDADQKFKPVQLIPLATLKAEVAASSDFADFQSRIAAL